MGSQVASRAAADAWVLPAARLTHLQQLEPESIQIMRAVVFAWPAAQHRWDARKQRPERWRLYNARENPGEGLRVFPISNWTELDISQYVYLESIPIVPLYYSAERPVVERDGSLIMVDGHP